MWRLPRLRNYFLRRCSAYSRITYRCRNTGINIQRSQTVAGAWRTALSDIATRASLIAAPAQYVERQIEQLILLPRRIRMPGLFLCGESGMGKTHLLRRIERRHPERDDADGKRRLRPVLYVQVPAAPTVRSLRRTLIDEANIPFLDHPSKPLPESILRRGLAVAGTQLIVLDEVHNILHVAWQQRRLLLDWLRYLSNETQLPLVLAGTEEFENAIHADPQLASRCRCRCRAPAGSGKHPHGGTFFATSYQHIDAVFAPPRRECNEFPRDDRWRPAEPTQLSASSWISGMGPVTRTRVRDVLSPRKFNGHYRVCNV
jgi:Bacterial TniB protein